MPSLPIDETLVRSVVEEVVRAFARNGGTIGTASASTAAAPSRAGAGPALVSTRNSGPRYGVFQDVPSAVAAAQAAYLQLCVKGVAARAKVVEIVKALATQNAEEWGKFEFAETKIGRLDHKIEKLQIVKLVPGVEWLHPDARSGDHGITLEEYTPFGVIAAILPMTHSIPTLSGNIINIVAAGNAVIFNPHPGGARSAALAVRAYNEAITAATGIENLVCTIEQPTLESFDALCQAPEVRVLCVTGGPAVVAAAMKSGKRAICAGPGNPPVLVDDTVNFDKAARDIIQGAAYDNNLLCVGEKEVFVLDKVADKLISAFARNGARQLNSSQLERLTAAAFTNKPDAGGCSHPVLNRSFVGVDAAVLARHAGTEVPANTPLLFAETDANHAFVIEEQMMPMIPIVRVKSVEEGVAAAVKAEHGYKHSAIIHSLNVDHMTMMARALDTTVFIKNGPCVAGLGLGGEGYLSYSIATTTGEGITTPRTFTRTRRCVMVDNLRIY
ncbi:aldehyde dehydrogenase [Opitutus terrae]|uniref:Aldehyde Dehydrogenase n=1 Tax=Opitutus terrae (strain DSM 11246 / JCM 15787 / PB90-1) TaxID=452637 RepID=B1ZR93_OPITP|nr:aldehyde dehydrogenase [Opitutus terrae]ACB74580.1 Aldehyde Dehydrogenase [Opitutus terrae PB90-1]